MLRIKKQKANQFLVGFLFFVVKTRALHKKKLKTVLKTNESKTKTSENILQTSENILKTNENKAKTGENTRKQTENNLLTC